MEVGEENASRGASVLRRRRCPAACNSCSVVGEQPVEPVADGDRRSRKLHQNELEHRSKCSSGCLRSYVRRVPPRRARVVMECFKREVVLAGAGRLALAAMDLLAVDTTNIAAATNDAAGTSCSGGQPSIRRGIWYSYTNSSGSTRSMAVWNSQRSRRSWRDQCV